MPGEELHRPDPDQLLRQLEAEREQDGRGRLKVFLGYSSGVGKSFRMVDEGRRRKARGQDVVAGALQPDFPGELESILATIEVIPLQRLNGVCTMDLGAILRRSPQVCLIDGLARDNPPGSHNLFRWQDVEQLLDAGINVITSVNLQYIEERREEVERLTGKHVTETVPAKFLDRADEIEIVDAPPAHPRKNLSELREIALILTADIIDRQLATYLSEHGLAPHLGAQERILVCITPRANAAKMIASGKRVAERFHGGLIAAWVEQLNLSDEDRLSLDRNLDLARQAGAEIAPLDGDDPIDTILQFALKRGVTQIFVGHSMRSTGFPLFKKTPVDRLLDKPLGIDIRVFPH